MHPIVGAIAFLMVLFGGAMDMSDFDDIASWKIVARTMMIVGVVLLIIGAVLAE